MTTTADRQPHRSAPRDKARFGRTALGTLPIVLAGSLALSMNLTGPIQLDPEKRAEKDKASSPDTLKQGVRKAFAAAGAASVEDATVAPAEASVAAAPSSYTVVAGGI